MCSHTRRDAPEFRRQLIAIIQRIVDETGFVDKHEVVDTATTEEIDPATVEQAISRLRRRGAIEIQHDGRIRPTHQ